MLRRSQQYGVPHILWDVDTKDYLDDDSSLIVNSENYFVGNISNTAQGHGYIPLAHDIHQQTASKLVVYMLDTLNARGYKVVTVGECLGDDKANWCRDAGGIPGSSSTAATSQGISTPRESMSTTSAAISGGTTLAATTTTTSHAAVATTTMTTVVKPKGIVLTASSLVPCGLFVSMLMISLRKLR